MSNVTLKIDGLKLLARLVEPSVLRPYLTNALRDAAEEILDTPGARNYPPASEANLPGRFNVKSRRPMGYYLRGQGWMYPVMRPRTLGSGNSEGVGMAAVRSGLNVKLVRSSAQVAGYKLRKTSERYGTQFYTRPVSTGQYAGVVIGNRAKYAPYLGFRLQSRLQAVRGWKRIADVASDRQQDVQKLIQERVELLFRQLAK